MTGLSFRPSGVARRTFLRASVGAVGALTLASGLPEISGPAPGSLLVKPGPGARLPAGQAAGLGDRFVPVVHQHKAGGPGARSNAYLVEGASGVVTVDALLTVSEAWALRATLEALHKPLVALVITHGHPDHYGGAAEIVGPEDVPVLALRSVDAAIRSDFAAKAERLRQALGEEWSPKRAYANRLLTDGESISFDDLTLTAHEVGPGESQSDSYWIVDGQASRLAFIGDIVMNRMHGYLAEGHSGAWLRNLQWVRGELADVPVLYPGHGEAGEPEMFDWERGYLEAYRETVRALAAGRPALTDDQKQELQRQMVAFLPDDKLTEFILRSSDAVAAELAAES